MEERFFSPTSNNSEFFGSVETFSSNQDLQTKENQPQLNRSQQSLDEQIGNGKNLGQLLEKYNSNQDDQMQSFIKQQSENYKQAQQQTEYQPNQLQNDSLPVISEYLEQRNQRNQSSKSYQQYLQEQLSMGSSLERNLEAQNRMLLNNSSQNNFHQNKGFQNPQLKYFLDNQNQFPYGSNHTLSQVYQGIQNQNSGQFNTPVQEDKQDSGLLKKFTSLRMTEPLNAMPSQTHQKIPQLNKTVSDVSHLMQGVQNQKFTGSSEEVENLLQRSLQQDPQNQDILLNLFDNHLKQQTDKNDFSGLNTPSSAQLKNSILRQLYQSQSENFEPQRRLQNLELLGGMHPKALSDLSSYFSLLNAKKEGQQPNIIQQDSSLSYQSQSDLPLPSQRQLDNKALRIHGFSESINPKEAKSAVLTALKVCAPQVASTSCLLQVIDMRVKSTVRGQHVGSKYVIMDFKEEKFCSWCKQLLESFKIPRGQRLIKREDAEALGLEVADQLPDYESYLDTEVTLVVYYANIKLKQTDKQQGLKQKFQRGGEVPDRNLGVLDNKILQQQLLQEQAKANMPIFQQQNLNNLFQNPGQQQYPFLDMDLTQQNQLNLGSNNMNPFAQPLFEESPQNLQQLQDPRDLPGSSSKILEKASPLPQLRLNIQTPNQSQQNPSVEKNQGEFAPQDPPPPRQEERSHPSNQYQSKSGLEGLQRAQGENYTQLLNSSNANSLLWQQNHAVSADSFFLKSLAEELEEQQAQKDGKDPPSKDELNANKEPPPPQQNQPFSVYPNQEQYIQNLKTFQDQSNFRQLNSGKSTNAITTPHQQPQNFYDNLFSPPQESQHSASDRWANLLGEQSFSPQSDQASNTPTLLSPPQKSFNEQGEPLEVTVDPRVLRVCGFKQCMKSREVRAAIVTIIYEHSYLSQYISKIKDIRVKVTRDGQYVGYKYGIVDFEEEKISKDVKMRMDGMEIEQGTKLVGQDQLASSNIKKQILVYLPQKSEEMRCSVKLCIYYANIRQKSLQDHNSQRSNFVTYYVNDPYKPHKVVTQKPSLGSNSKSENFSQHSGQQSNVTLEASKSHEIPDMVKQAQDQQQRQLEQLQNSNSQLYMQLQNSSQLFGQDTTGFVSNEQKNEYLNKENRYAQNYQNQVIQQQQTQQQQQQYWNHYQQVQSQYNLVPQNLGAQQPNPQYQLPKFSSLPPNFYNK